jgi:putative tryptophan/tyrosine transport system substrate-binding protein
VPKRLELLREILPNARRVGLLRDPTEPLSKANRDSIGLAAKALGLTIVWADMSSPSELDTAMAKLTGQGVDVIYASTTIAVNLRARIVELANRKRVPVFLNRAHQLDSGALFSYGSSQTDQLRRSAHVVDKILKGAKPADIPVEQPTLFELVVNLKAAKALGITIPQPILLRADRVIE